MLRPCGVDGVLPGEGTQQLELGAPRLAADQLSVLARHETRKAE